MSTAFDSVPKTTLLLAFKLPQAPANVAVTVAEPLKPPTRLATPLELTESPSGLLDDQEGVVPNGWFSTVNVPEEHIGLGPDKLRE